MQQQGRFTDAATKDSIADMYAKCGCLALPRAVFNQLPWRNVITWNVLMMAYGMHGLGDEAIVLFDRTVTSELRQQGVNWSVRLQGLSRPLPRWHARMTCHVSKSDKYVVVLLFCVANL
jgi:pentatricopeptide repeat protein